MQYRVPRPAIRTVFVADGDDPGVSPPTEWYSSNKHPKLGDRQLSSCNESVTVK